MNDICPVCGKGEWEVVGTYPPIGSIPATEDRQYVSHLDCVRQVNESLHRQAAFTQEWCQRAEQAEAAIEKMRQDYNTMSHACLQAEAEVERLKWMLDHASEFYLGQDEGWIDNDPDAIADLDRRYREAHRTGQQADDAASDAWLGGEAL